jgi:hypothetical protein
LFNRLPVILLVMLSLVPPTAQASIIAGTWSVSITAWNTNFPNNGHPPPPPVNAAATFAFDDTTSAFAVPIAQFTSNFGVTSARYSFLADLRELIFVFDAGPSNLAFAYILPSSRFTTPQWTDDSATGGNSSFASAYTGTFIPMPEPATAALIVLGVALLGLVRDRMTRPTRRALVGTACATRAPPWKNLAARFMNYPAPISVQSGWAGARLTLNLEQ